MTTEYEKSGLLHWHLYTGTTYETHHYGQLASTADTNQRGPTLKLFVGAASRRAATELRL